MDDAFGNWFAGFFDGEGCFQITRTGPHGFTCEAVITLRADDRPILEAIRENVGVGLVLDRRTRGNPASLWRARSRADCLRVIEVFDRYPLRAKKGTDFATWRSAVTDWAAMTRLGNKPNDWSRVAACAASLRESRRYVAREE